MAFTDRLLDELASELGAHLAEVAEDARRILDADGVNYTFDTSNGMYATAAADRARLEVRGEVGSSGRHARYAHDGRRPGKWPPDRPIRDWLRIKKGVPEGPELNRATYLVRRKIGRQGVRGSRFLDRAFAARLDDLRPRLARAADRALDGVSIL